MSEVLLLAHEDLEEDLVQSTLAIDYDLARFRNEEGFIRRGLIKGQIDLTRRSELELVQVAYSEWLLDDIYLSFKHTVSKTEVQTGRTESKVEYQAIKCRKRGNDVDAFRIDRRMRQLHDSIVPFIPKAIRSRSTSALYVTGTVDPKKVGHDVERAWRDFGKWFNSFLSGLRKKCITVQIDEKDGKPFIHEVPCKILVLRSWESHESGWPHFHAILCFEGFAWGIFQDKNSRWRVKEKDRIQDSWTHGFVDVVALTRGTLDKNLQNVLWYVSKNLSSMDYRLVRSWPVKRRETQSILWYFGMRSFSVSRGLIQKDLEPDPDDLIKPSSITQVDLDGKPAILELHEWEFIGLVRRLDTELERDDWKKTYKDPPGWLERAWKPWSSHSGMGWTDSWGG